MNSKSVLANKWRRIWIHIKSLKFGPLQKLIDDLGQNLISCYYKIRLNNILLESYLGCNYKYIIINFVYYFLFYNVYT